MIPLIRRLFPGKEKIWMSRPWDLTEIVPVHETLWFRVCAGLIAAFLVLLLIAVLL